jgi:hypothetical protein
MFISNALSETTEPLVGLTANCMYSLVATAFANVVPAKFVELYEFESAAGLIPDPRERIPVFNRGSVIIEAMVASLPAFPDGSHARMTASTNGAEGSLTAAKARSGAISTIGVARPRKSFTESKNAMPAFVEALVVTTSVRAMAMLNITVRISFERNELGRLNIVYF